MKYINILDTDDRNCLINIDHIVLIKNRAKYTVICLSNGFDIETTEAVDSINFKILR